MDDTSANEIVTEFLSEVEGYLPTMRSCLSTLQKERGNRQAAEELHRICHTIKGAAAMLGLEDLSKTGELLEDTMEQVVGSTVVMDDELIALFGETVGRISTFCALAEQGEMKDSHLCRETSIAFQKKFSPKPAVRPEASALEKSGDSLADILDQLLSRDNSGKVGDDFFLLDEDLEEKQTRFTPKDCNIDPELLACFSEEAEEHLANINVQLKQLTEAAADEAEISPELRESLHSLRRSVHTLKGAAAVIGIEPVAAWGRVLEDFLDTVHDDFVLLRPETAAAMRQGSDLLARIAEDSGCSVETEKQDIAARFKQVVEHEAAGAKKAAGASSDEPPFEPAPEDFFAWKKVEESPETLLEQLDETAEDSDSLFQESGEEDIFAIFPELATEKEQAAPPVKDVPPEPAAVVPFFAEEQSEETADALFDELTAEAPGDDGLFAAFPEPVQKPVQAIEEDAPVDPELLECFSEETAEHLENIDLQLNQLDAAAQSDVELSSDLREMLHSLRRSVHTLKGAAAVIGIKPVAAWGHEFEDFLDWLHDESPILGPTTVSAMREGADLLAKLTEEPGCAIAEEKEAVTARFKEIIAARPQSVTVAEAPPPIVEDSAVAELLVEEPAEAKESQPEDAVDPELLECFSEEATEHLENIDRQLHLLDEAAQGEVELAPALREMLHSLRRSVHTLKGAAAVIGIQPIAAWGHTYEDFLDWLHDESSVLRPDTIALMQEAADLLAKITENPALPAAEKKEAISVRFHRMMEGEAAVHEPIPATPATEVVPAPHPEPAAAPVSAPAAREAGGVRKINTLRVDVNRIDQVVGLSGDMVINLSSFEASMTAMSGTLNELGMILQRLKNINVSLEAGYELASIPYLSSAADASGTGLAEDFDPLEMDRYSELNILIRSLSEAVGDLDSIMAQSALENIAWQKTVERQERVLKDIQNRMIGLRMTPLSVLAARMQRTVREAEKTTGHPAQLILEGESIMMDTRVWDTMADALMHILRNAVAHGGRPDSNLTVRIKAERRGGQFVLGISDDGCGLNYEAIRAKGMKLYPDEQVGSMTDEKLASLIFRHGFSSAGEITSIAGRGVGMDVVRDAVAQLNGSTEIASVRGQGLRLLIRLPVAVAQLQAVLTRLAGQVYAVPMHDIDSVARITPEEAVTKEYTFAGVQLPLVRPTAVPGFFVGEAGEPPAENEQAVLLIHTGNKRAALLCEQLIGQRDVVFKDLGEHLRHVSCISGVTVLGDGSLIPILQTDELVKKWIEVSGFAQEAVVVERVEERPLRILVVDDSISVRKVVSNFILQQGWQPTVARNGIEAVERIREERPDFVLLDIEMPRMNGFEVLQALQGQPEFRNLPVAMLTSRSADKYREKATQLGARGFLNKPFKADEVVALIRGLTGH